MCSPKLFGASNIDTRCNEMNDVAFSAIIPAIGGVSCYSRAGLPVKQMSFWFFFSEDRWRETS